MAKAQKVPPTPADTKRLAGAALADLNRARQSIERLSAAVEAPVKGVFNAPSSTGTDLASWRAAHRSGTPSKLDTDAELRAFVMDRIETLTYGQIVQAVAAAFPADRRTSVSALSRWFLRNGRTRGRGSIG